MDETVEIIDFDGNIVRTAVTILGVAFSPDGQMVLSTEGFTAYLQPIFLP